MTQRRQFAAKHASGVNVDGAVQPLGFRDRRMSIYHHRPATIVSRPVVPNGQSELICLACRIPPYGKIPHPPRRPVLVSLLHPCMRHNKMPAIQHIMPDEAVDELLGGFA